MGYVSLKRALKIPNKLEILTLQDGTLAISSNAYIFGAQSEATECQVDRIQIINT